MTPGETRAERAETRAEEAEERTDLAEDRTEWANLRTVLAKERTFSAWMRTGLATLVAGLAVLRFLRQERGDGGVALWGTALGVLLVMVSAVIFGIGWWSYHSTVPELEEAGVRGLPTPLLLGVAAALVVGCGLGLLLVL